MTSPEDVRKAREILETVVRTLTSGRITIGGPSVEDIAVEVIANAIAEARKEGPQETMT